ncbi:hypothetical protein BH23ACT12_BH23ACT12_23710 [soil metagenome]
MADQTAQQMSIHNTIRDTVGGWPRVEALSPTGSAGPSFAWVGWR